MRELAGQCHCGNISYRLRWPQATGRLPVRACGCGYCRMHGAMWVSRPDARLSVTVADPAAVSRYRFGTRTGEFHVCARCGILTFAHCDLDDAAYAVVNANTLEDLPAAAFDRTETDFEGEDESGRLVRRRRTWMPASIT